MRSVWGAHASRVLARRLAIADFALTRALQEMLKYLKTVRRDAETNTRDACAPQTCNAATKLSICAFADSFACYDDD